MILKDLQSLFVTKIDFEEGESGIGDIVVVMQNGEAKQGGSRYVCNQSISSLEDLARIDTIFEEQEGHIFSLRFTYRDSKIETIGAKLETHKPGRIESFTLDEGERLFGCRLFHGEHDLQGVTWIKCKFE